MCFRGVKIFPFSLFFSFPFFFFSFFLFFTGRYAIRSRCDSNGPSLSQSRLNAKHRRGRPIKFVFVPACSQGQLTTRTYTYLEACGNNYFPNSNFFFACSGLIITDEMPGKCTASSDLS